ncbi:MULTISPECIES: LAETG motif-containing sortase-dependent surface protein [Streptomyces]|uniref:TQXA domain-containing protein/LPXTG-motif cell wall-anchored protein n=1 Tax=Streptomyces demainii TaxID=588122 RepID=A0ABT9KRI5_9ACTN|nr:LAETG motif-containing sortase-dependent surface protein [Streptomyces demainii]MDP9610026.1 TQXA domain-containing protein/LPXTG-motif cell wall-anchored protein [Streptomyces demainii]
MISVRRRGTARLAAAVLASGLVAAGAIATAGTAAADDVPPGQGGATATLSGLKTFDKAVIHDNGKDQQVGAGLFEMSVDNGGSIQTYCIDLHNPTQSKAKYEEKSWAETSLANNPNAGKINWILQNSYPQVNDLDALAKTAGAGALTEKTAAAGTQVAIWRFSDNAKVDAVDPQAEKLADYLEKSAQNVGEPKASLSLDPPAVSGKAGQRLGPVTVHTNADSVTLTPGTEAAGSGVKLVDGSGKTITSAADGGEVYFDVPDGASDGSATLTAQASTKVPVGRAFSSATKSQTQILAGSSESTVSATATANWAKQGAVPAVSAEKNCAKGGVDITATNKGDEAFGFELLGQKYTVEAGQSKTVTAPVKEDESYTFTITGPNGFEKTFSGVLDCKTSSSGGGSGDTPSSQPSPASAGGSGTGGDTTGGDLAETGSSSNTPMIAGIAVALVVVGGGAVFLVRRKKAPAGE